MKFKSLKRILIGGFAVAATFGMASCSGEEALNTDFINETNDELKASAWCNSLNFLNSAPEKPVICFWHSAQFSNIPVSLPFFTA